MRYPIAVSLVMLATCRDPAMPAPPLAGTTVVDSVVPVAEALDRFRRGLERPDSLQPASDSRDALIREFVAALERADTAALARLALTPAEFAWFFYPTSAYARPPYDLSPELFWYTMNTRGHTGLTRLLAAHGGRQLGFLGYTCPADPEVEGDNRIHAPCAVSFVTSRGDTVQARLFGPILERGGRFKLVNFANDLE